MLIYDFALRVFVMSGFLVACLLAMQAASADEPRAVQQASTAAAQVAPPYAVPPELAYVTTTRPPFIRLLGPVRAVPIPIPVDVPDKPERDPAPPEQDRIPERGIVPIDENDADGDGYIEYYENGHYIAILKENAKGDLADAKPEAERRIRTEGVVAAREFISMKDHEGEHLVVRMRDDEGMHTLADLGLATDYEGVELAVGDKIKLSARLGTINDKPALIADEVTVGDKTVEAKR